ncbi:hypothetical protein I302_101102 [Kwoniella bestiolae CBS 10118]|uniref:Uncharacterized protein n=1 Tax=Kwoniella bestiolae CBS 10118 TaxID=1296100 RepID=A0A1B9G6Y0_9TREE|nr:hypothetical protein I302_04477 [Kwoniella bestiolae CBS 10118]OCF26787.1 hypothetical protein I302_04477 [Kwoniella bestiolae CBS 10118]
MGNKQSAPCSPKYPPKKPKKVKKKDFAILTQHRPPGYTNAGSDFRIETELHSDKIRRQLEEMDALRSAARARSEGEDLPSYEASRA